MKVYSEILKVKDLSKSTRAAVYHNRGLVFQQLGNSAASLEDFQAGMVLQSDSPELKLDMLLHVGQVYGDLHRYSEAIMIFRKLIEDDNSYLPAHVSLAITYSRMGEYQTAIDSLDIALSMSKGNPELLRRRAYTLQQLKRLDEAISDIEAVIACDESDVNSRLLQARMYRDLGNFDDATASLERILKLDVTKEHEVCKELGLLYSMAEKVDLAIKSFERAILTGGGCSESWTGLARCYKRELSETEVIKKILSTPTRENSALVYACRGTALYKVGLAAAGLEQLNEALRLRRHFPWARLVRGTLHLEVGRYGDAVEDFSDALRGMPDDAVALERRAIGRIHLGHYDAALGDFDRVLAVRPDRPRVRLLRAALARRVGGDQYGEEGFEAPTSEADAGSVESRESSDALRDEAFSLAARGDLDAARDKYAELLRVAPRAVKAVVADLRILVRIWSDDLELRRLLDSFDGP